MANNTTTPDEIIAVNEKKLRNIGMTRMAASSAGIVAGAVYAFRTKKKFWGYVGFMLLGSIVIGGVVGIATSPAAGKAINEIEEAKKKK